MARPSSYGVKNEYASWVAMPKKTKISLNMPTTKSDFASMKGVSRRTLNRWEEEAEFQEIVKQRRAEFIAAPVEDMNEAVGGPRAPVHGNVKQIEPELTGDEAKYAHVKDTLVRMAMDGNQQAIDMYMKHYGKPFIEAEQRSTKMFPNMSDEQLTAEIIKILGSENIAKVLAHNSAE